MFLSAFRSLLYRTASTIGDVQAVSKGPKAIAKRAVRKAAYRHVGRAMRRLFR